MRFAWISKWEYCNLGLYCRDVFRCTVQHGCHTYMSLAYLENGLLSCGVMWFSTFMNTHAGDACLLPALSHSFEVSVELEFESIAADHRGVCCLFGGSCKVHINSCVCNRNTCSYQEYVSVRIMNSCDAWQKCYSASHTENRIILTVLFYTTREQCNCTSYSGRHRH